jgi:RNA polymerase sigma-70 factor (ECF subfamily)
MLPPATVERFREGDPEAFAALMREFGPLVRSIVAHYFRGAFEREDAIQEVWLHAFRNRSALDSTRAADLPGWLGVLARHRCLDLWRRRPDEVPGADPVESNDGTLPVEPIQVAAAEAGELQQAVIEFEGRLQPAFRAFFRLYFVEGLPYEDVAAKLGISRLRCKYLKRVLAARARKDATLLSALGRYRATPGSGGPLAS